METIKKQWSIVLCVILAMVLCLQSGTPSVCAAEPTVKAEVEGTVNAKQGKEKKPSCMKSKKCYVIDSHLDGSINAAAYAVVKRKTNWKQALDNWCIRIKNISKKAKVTDITSSNTKVIKGGDYYYDSKKSGYISLDFPFYHKQNAVVEGTSKISFKVHQNGKTYKLSCKFTMKKIASPFKTLKISGKNYASKFKKTDLIELNPGKTSVRVKYKTKKNVKIISCSFYNNKKGKAVKVKNNSKIAIPKEGGQLYIVYRYKSKLKGYKKLLKYAKKCVLQQAIEIDFNPQSD